MALVFSARKICEEALGLIGVFTINDEAPPAEAMDVALNWLDINVAELGGTRIRQWLVESNKTITLTGGVPSFDLDGVFNIDGMQFPIQAMLHTGNQNYEPVRIVDRREFDSLSKPDTSGDPEICYIDRLPTPTLRIYPVPAATVTPTRELILTFAEFPVNIGDSISGNTATKMRPAWQRWMIYQMAADLGSGRVRRLDIRERREFLDIAEVAKRRLEAFEDRPHDNSPPISEPAWM